MRPVPLPQAPMQCSLLRICRRIFPDLQASAYIYLLYCIQISSRFLKRFRHCSRVSAEEHLVIRYPVKHNSDGPYRNIAEHTCGVTARTGFSYLMYIRMTLADFTCYHCNQEGQRKDYKCAQSAKAADQDAESEGHYNGGRCHGSLIYRKGGKSCAYSQ